MIQYTIVRYGTISSVVQHSTSMRRRRIIRRSLLKNVRLFVSVCVNAIGINRREERMSLMITVNVLRLIDFVSSQVEICLFSR